MSTTLTAREKELTEAAKFIIISYADELKKLKEIGSGLLSADLRVVDSTTAEYKKVFEMSLSHTISGAKDDKISEYILVNKMGKFLLTQIKESKYKRLFLINKVRVQLTTMLLFDSVMKKYEG